MDAVALTQLTFQMLTVLNKISISPEPLFKYMGEQMSGQAVRPFSMNSKVAGSSLPTLSKEYPFVSRK